MMPMHISYFHTNATEMATNGILRTKLFVPSIGSMIHVGFSLSGRFDASDSSAMNLIITNKNHHHSI